MGTTLLLDFDTFKRDILPPLPAGAREPPKDKIASARIKLFKTFRGKFEPHGPVTLSEEDAIAEAVVGAINALELPDGYWAKLSKYEADLSDDTEDTENTEYSEDTEDAEDTEDTESKVCAGIYPQGTISRDEHPDWTNCRLFIDFQRGDVAYDPWGDRAGNSSEAERSSRAKVRSQLIACAHNLFLYQHRTALLSLLVIGEEFRALWWDRSGVCVSRKVNYVDEPEHLLGIVWHYVQLSAQGQGIDPTATYIEEGSAAFRIMDELAMPSELDMDYLEPGTEHIETESSRSRLRAPTASSTPPAAEPICTAASPIGESDYSGRQRADLQPDADLPEPKDDGEDRRVFKYVREKFRESLAPGWPRYKLRVGDDDHVFLVAKPVVASSSMFGRATRGYIAVDARTRRFVFLKDSWRPYYEGVRPEGSYLELFADDPDMVVPTVICHGDVRNQETFNARYEADPQLRFARNRHCLQALQTRACRSASTTGPGTSKKRRRGEEDDGASSSRRTAGTSDLNSSLSDKSLGPHMHYRIAVKEVCLPFSDFRTTKQLIRLMYDCIATHHWAYTRHNLLHRDISAGNVLILPTLGVNPSGKEVVEWRGLLTDWELAKPVSREGEDDSEAARPPERTGTWQFMSVNYVASHWRRPVVVADELESFFHVLLYYAVRFIRNTLQDVTSFVIAYFDESERDTKSDRRWCSHLKAVAMRHRSLCSHGVTLEFLRTTGEGRNPLNTLLEQLLLLISARYEVLSFNRQLAQTHTEHRQRTAAVVDHDATASDASTPPSPLRAVWPRNEPWAEPRLRLEPPKPKVLDPETIKMADSLETHIPFLQIFYSMIKDTPAKDWRDTHVLPEDGLLANYKRVIIVVACDGYSIARTARPTKRAKVASMSSYAAKEIPATIAGLARASANTSKEDKGSRS
ncbi:hypothetical protein OH77DRAFT_146381 [Trametes cingulata]|nr:hypothetical protein OH77DRAFT_146381 [Trametes cingulata]